MTLAMAAFCCLQSTAALAAGPFGALYFRGSIYPDAGPAAVSLSVPVIGLRASITPTTREPPLSETSAPPPDRARSTAGTLAPVAALSPTPAPGRARASLAPPPPAHAGRPERGARTGAGIASWYGGGEKLSRLTASGEPFQPDGMTAAHRTLPLGSRVNVSANGRTIVVRVNDRGPAARTGREIDLSKGAAKALGFIHKGTTRVQWWTADAAPVSTRQAQR